MTRTLDDLRSYFDTVPDDLVAERRLRQFAAALIDAPADSADPDPDPSADIRLIPSDTGRFIPRRVRKGWLLPAAAAAVLIAVVGTTVGLDHPGHSHRAAPAASSATDADLPAPLVPADPTPDDYPLSFAYVPQGWKPTSWADGHVNLTKDGDTDSADVITVTLISGSQPRAVDQNAAWTTYLQLRAEDQPTVASPSSTGFLSLPSPQGIVYLGVIGPRRSGDTTIDANQTSASFRIDRPLDLSKSEEVLRRFVEGITTRPDATPEPSKSLNSTISAHVN